MQVADTVPTHVRVAKKYLFVREKTGNNDGEEVEQFLAFVGLPRGYPWCAAFVSYVLAESGNAVFKTGLARNYWDKTSVKLRINAKDVLLGRVKVPPGSLVIWARGNTTSGHIAIMEYQPADNQFQTVEGNTGGRGISGEYEGNGVFEKPSRKIEPGNMFRIIGFVEVK